MAHRSHSLLRRMTASSWSATRQLSHRLPRARGPCQQHRWHRVWPYPRQASSNVVLTSRALDVPHASVPQRSPTVNGGQPPCPQSRASSRAGRARVLPKLAGHRSRRNLAVTRLPTGPSPPDSRASLPRPSVTRGSSLVAGWGCVGRRTVPARRPRRARPGQRGARAGNDRRSSIALHGGAGRRTLRPPRYWRSASSWQAC